MDPAIYQYYQASTFQSSKSFSLSKNISVFFLLILYMVIASKGKAAYLLKCGSKRRRRQVKIIAEDN